MNRIEQLIRSGKASSELAYRPDIYAPDDDAGVVIDCLALANADVSVSRRFVFLGVDGSRPEGRRLVGVDGKALARFRQRFASLIARTIEPELCATVRFIKVDGHLIGYIRIKRCEHRPYLTREPVGDKLASGVGYIRRGAVNESLRRSDLKRMFAEDAPEPARKPGPAAIVEFAGDKPANRMRLRALALRQLPSQLAADRLRALIRARDQSREVFGRTTTRLSRLVHARLYGVEQPFEQHSDESLCSWLENVDADYRAADQHYEFELRAHKVNLQVRNTTPGSLSNAVLKLTFSQLPGFGVADRIYREAGGEESDAAYPVVRHGEHATMVAAELGTLPAAGTHTVFAEPLRIWVREEAAGHSAAIAWQLTAEELSEPVTGDLVISCAPLQRHT